MTTRKPSKESSYPPCFEDCLCPVCLEILIEPVTMPCSHELCMPCFQQNVNESSLTCPMCRLRISNWARNAARTKTLIDQVRWRSIRKYFSKQVALRMSGRSDYESVTVPPVHEVAHILAEPGEIRREFETEIRKFEEQLKLEKAQEEAASNSLIEKLQLALMCFIPEHVHMAVSQVPLADISREGEIDAAGLQVEETDEIIAHQLAHLEADQETDVFLQRLRENLDERTRVYSVFGRMACEGVTTTARSTPTDPTPEPPIQYEPDTKPNAVAYASEDSRTSAACSSGSGSSSSDKTLSSYVALKRIDLDRHLMSKVGSSQVRSSDGEEEGSEDGEGGSRGSADHQAESWDDQDEDSHKLSSFCTPKKGKLENNDVIASSSSTTQLFSNDKMSASSRYLRSKTPANRLCTKPSSKKTVRSAGRKVPPRKAALKLSPNGSAKLTGRKVPPRKSTLKLLPKKTAKSVGRKVPPRKAALKLPQKRNFTSISSSSSNSFSNDESAHSTHYFRSKSLAPRLYSEASPRTVARSARRKVLPRNEAVQLSPKQVVSPVGRSVPPRNATLQLSPNEATTSAGRRVSRKNAGVLLSQRKVANQAGRKIPLQNASLMLSSKEVTRSTGKKVPLRNAPLRLSPNEATRSTGRRVSRKNAGVLLSPRKVTKQTGRMIPLRNASMMLSSKEVTRSTGKKVPLRNASVMLSPKEVTKSTGEKVSRKNAELGLSPTPVTRLTGETVRLKNADMKLSPKEAMSSTGRRVRLGKAAFKPRPKMATRSAVRKVASRCKVQSS